MFLLTYTYSRAADLVPGEARAPSYAHVCIRTYADNYLRLANPRGRETEPSRGHCAERQIDARDLFCFVDVVTAMLVAAAAAALEESRHSPDRRADRSINFAD